MEIKYFLMSGVSIATLAYICGWLYVGVYKLKMWICDEESTHYCKWPFAVWLNRTFKFGDKVDYGVELFITCFMLCISLVILSGAVYFPIGRAIVATAGGVATLVFVGSHAARWMMRTKKAISKVKNLSHKHEEV